MLAVAALVGALAVPMTAAARRAEATNTVGASLLNLAHPAKTRLQIRLDGRLAYNQLVRSSVCHADCTTVDLAPSKKPLRLLDLEHNNTSDLVLGLYSGGAHCCFIDQVFRLRPGTSEYVKTEHNFRDPGARIEDLAHNGRYEFLSADDTFAYAFTDFAHSGLPIQIWSFTAGRFTKVTRQFPKLIRADAARWLRTFDRNLGNGDGAIAAWAADEDLLGNFKQVRTKLAAELKANHLKSPLPGETGPKFVSQLQKLLRRDGYTRS